jgi:hypothetical protein
MVINLGQQTAGPDAAVEQINSKIRDVSGTPDEGVLFRQ